jgi:hypothetical protein
MTPQRNRLAAAAALLAIGALPAAAQQDSIQARLRALEATVEMLQKQLAEQATTAMQTRSRIQLELTGRVVANAFTNERGTNNVDNPQFVRRDSAILIPSNGFGMAIRQTMFGLRTQVSDVAGGTFRGVVDVDFYGGQLPSSGGRTFPLLRLRTAHGTIHWAHGEIMAGQEIPLVSPQNPISPAAFGTPGFVAAGNLWLWLPQVRGTIEKGAKVKFALQGAVLAPTSGDAVGTFDTDFDVAERSRKPYLETRLRLRWGEDPSQQSEVGCAGHIGWVAVPTVAHPKLDSTLTSKVIGCDARISIFDWLELRGEVYGGQLARGLGGGGVGQGIGTGGRPIQNTAGWAQLNLRPVSQLQLGAGCGADDPDDFQVQTLGVNARYRNASCAVYSIVRPAGPVFVGAEVRRLDTRYQVRTFRNHHLNLALGFEF